MRFHFHGVRGVVSVDGCAASCLRTLVLVLVGAVVSLLAPPGLLAQTDEIQVYDAAIADPGVLALTLHNNFTPVGLKTPAFPGGLIPDKSLNGVPEFGYGVTDWFEAGLYLPLYSISKDRGASINGGKLRALFVRPHAADHRFFYGLNFEFSYNARHWDPRKYTSEIRPIIGWHLHPVDIIVNPILDNSYVGGFKSLDFAPETRVAYNYSASWTFAVEEYADFGPLRNFYAGREQQQQIYGVVDHGWKSVSIEAGVGVGLTGATSKLTLKLLLTKGIYALHKKETP